jgi:alkyl hydroperoxide reductase subunit AhpC
MTLHIGDVAPDFEAETTEGGIRFHEWLGDSWAVLFSHPKDFTAVCTTELGYMARMKPEFDKRSTKIVGLSVDPVEHHQRWANDQGHSGPGAELSDDRGHRSEGCQAVWDAARRPGRHLRRPDGSRQPDCAHVFVIFPDKKVKLLIVYPMTTWRNFDEVLRVIDSLQLTAKHKVATPVNWKQGDDVIIAGSVSDEEARKTYPQGWTAPRQYLRIVAQPGAYIGRPTAQ